MIPIRNVYYMLSYAFRVLQEQGYKDLAAEEFSNTGDLCAAILSKGISSQLKRGLGKAYVEETDALTSLRGKINIADTIKTQSLLRKKIVCTYDEFSVNTKMNQIIKSTVELLLKSNIRPERKKELRKEMVFFSDVDTVELANVDWHMKFDRNNQTYRMMMSICYLVVKGLLQTQTDGRTKMMDFFDEQRMCRLYEKFILEYYRKHFPELSANAAQIKWQLNDEMSEMLPIMQTDIMLSHGNDVLIIDAKYYEHTLQERFGATTLHSGNVYQIFTYVKNKEYELRNVPHKVGGMLLYAKTDEEIYPSRTYQMSGNRIAVRTLDLSLEFEDISKQLCEIVDDFFGDFLCVN